MFDYQAIIAPKQYKCVFCPSYTYDEMFYEPAAVWLDADQFRLVCPICEWQSHNESIDSFLKRVFGCCKHYNTILCECPVEPDPAATAKLKAFLP